MCADVDERSLLTQISGGMDVATLDLPLKLKLVKAASLLPGALQILQLHCSLIHMRLTTAAGCAILQHFLHLICLQPVSSCAVRSTVHVVVFNCTYTCCLSLQV